MITKVEELLTALEFKDAKVDLAINRQNYKKFEASLKPLLVCRKTI